MTSKIFGRIALALGAVLLVSLFAWEACSDELNVIQVHRNIPLSDEETAYKDIYISGGSDSGLKNNLVVQVLRKVIVKDATGSQSFGEIMVPVGQIKVIFVGPKVSVAREYKPANKDTVPALDQVGIQLGDSIELKGSFTDNNKPVTTVVVVPAAAAPVVAPTPAPAAPVVATPVQEKKDETSEPTASSREPAEEPKESFQ